MDMLKELLEKRAFVWQQMRDLNEASRRENRDLTAEEKEKWNKLDTEYLSLSERIEREQKIHEREREFSRTNNPGLRGFSREEIEENPERNFRDVFRSFLLNGTKRMSETDVAYLRKSGISIFSENEIEIPLSQRETRGLIAGTGSAGGFTVPTGFADTLEAALKDFSGVRQVARVVTTASGNALPWPTMNDTNNEGEIVAEEGSIGAHVGPTFGQVVLNAFKYSSKLVQISRELLEDSAFDLDAVISQALGERIGRISNRHFTVGTGTGQPQGVTLAPVGKVAAASTGITVDELLDLFHSVDPAYRNGPQVFWMFSDAVFTAIRKLTKADWAGGAAVWQPGLAPSAPDTVLGKPFVVNNHMPGFGVNNVTVVFGDFSRYLIRQVNTIRIRRLEELYAANDQVGFIAFLRQDGRLLDAGTGPIKALKMAAV